MSIINSIKNYFGFPVIDQTIELNYNHFNETKQGDYLSEVFYWKKHVMEKITPITERHANLDVSSLAYTEHPERAHHALMSVCSDLEGIGWKITRCSARNTDKYEQIQTIRGTKEKIFKS